MTTSLQPAGRARTDGPAPDPGDVTCAFVERDGEPWIRMQHADRLPPFLMTLASDTDLWMFVSSRGGLTAGRTDPDGALFPYETEDRLHDGHLHTGPITILRVGRGDRDVVDWEPFRTDTPPDAAIERRLDKHVTGHQLVFEEIHHGLGLAFRYRWAGCEPWGFVRTATLESLLDAPCRVELVDGMRNVLPFGAPLALYQHSSCLVDAYKRVDREPGGRLAIYSLTSRITDRPEAGEQLRAAVVWSSGLRGAAVCLSSEGVAAFRAGRPAADEHASSGRRGAYLMRAAFELGAREARRWDIAADTGRSHADVVALRERLRGTPDMAAAIDADLRAAGTALLRNIASADGLQLGAIPGTTAHHLANVLFNNMRGGVFADNGTVPAADFRDFVRTRNRRVATQSSGWLATLPEHGTAAGLLHAARDAGDPDLERLALEYLPLHFGRRHGDPSRPWNRFTIGRRAREGRPALHYQGNWRDIFQNWEALTLSFPAFLPHVIAKFVNASTRDGFNPYRITREGVDWEVADPNDPWSHIGYWGDHQIVYLLRLLEALEAHEPGALAGLLARDIFSYADVPYRLKSHAEIVRNPRASIVYDAEHAAGVAARVERIGSDGRLVHDERGGVLHVNLFEKLLVPVLAKLSCLVPGGGIWMNTQRPEWNDANNALAGPGVSVVTTFHLRRHLAFLAAQLDAAPAPALPVSAAVADWFDALRRILAGGEPALPAGRTGERERRTRMDQLGAAFEAYRAALLPLASPDRRPLGTADVAAFLHDAIRHLDHAIAANQRNDGLFHSYNLVEFDAERGDAMLHRLDLMLEGQVAAIGSGLIRPADAAAMVERLFASALHRPDQHSFLLQPDRPLPAFLDRNRVPAGRVAEIPLLVRLAADGDDSIVAPDAEGVFRFHADLRDARALEARIERLAQDERWAGTARSDRAAVLALFEDVFHHGAFLGRSGAMVAYEGLGSVYWHMVSKLLLAVQELAIAACGAQPPDPAGRVLASAYRRIRRGLCLEKSPSEYGAFPTDPYSHTPASGGARQPGMTGQVKEVILARFGELGVRVEGGCVSFRPRLLDPAEFLDGPAEFRHVDLDGEFLTLALPAGSLVFAYCQVPVIYERIHGAAWIRVHRRDGSATTHTGSTLTADISRELFARSGRVTRIEVGIPVASLLGHEPDGPRPH